jgi:hypothetical protein
MQSMFGRTGEFEGVFFFFPLRRRGPFDGITERDLQENYTRMDSLSAINKRRVDVVINLDLGYFNSSSIYVYDIMDLGENKK